jgi:hypothetical protein
VAGVGTGVHDVCTGPVATLESTAFNVASCVDGSPGPRKHRSAVSLEQIWLGPSFVLVEYGDGSATCASARSPAVVHAASCRCCRAGSQSPITAAIAAATMPQTANRAADLRISPDRQRARAAEVRQSDRQRRGSGARERASVTVIASLWLSARTGLILIAILRASQEYDEVTGNCGSRPARVISMRRDADPGLALCVSTQNPSCVGRSRLPHSEAGAIQVGLGHCRDGRAGILRHDGQSTAGHRQSSRIGVHASDADRYARAHREGEG